MNTRTRAAFAAALITLVPGTSSLAVAPSPPIPVTLISEWVADSGDTITDIDDRPGRPSTDDPMRTPTTPSVLPWTFGLAGLIMAASTAGVLLGRLRRRYAPATTPAATLRTETDDE